MVPALAESSKEPLFKEIRPGIFQFGDVKINRRQRTVSFSVGVNLTNGAMEYFLVSAWGKVHESIFRTDAQPYRIHAAMLLLGAEGMGTNAEDTLAVPSLIVSHPSSVRLPGDPVTLEIRWKLDRKEIRKRAEELVYNTKTKSILRKGNWVYNGSFLEDGSFLAQREGSIVSLVTDPEALINNTGPGHDDDTIWTPNTKSLPPADVPVEFIIKLAKRKSGR